MCRNDCFGSSCDYFENVVASAKDRQMIHKCHPTLLLFSFLTVAAAAVLVAAFATTASAPVLFFGQVFRLVAVVVLLPLLPCE